MANPVGVAAGASASTCTDAVDEKNIQQPLQQTSSSLNPQYHRPARELFSRLTASNSASVRSKRTCFFYLAQMKEACPL